MTYVTIDLFCLLLFAKITNIPVWSRKPFIHADCGMGDKHSTSIKTSKPKTLDDYGYDLVEDDTGVIRLLGKDNRKPFEFDVNNGNRWLNQQRYEAIGELITELVYERLEEHLKLEKVLIPIQAKEKEGKGFFFRSKDALQADKLLVLIHGSGVVRAGQWARSLIINDSWNSGTMEPYIIQAQQQGFGVIITNGNHNFDSSANKAIKGNENPEHHMVYVWKHFINNCNAKDVAVVAHSYGGVVLHHLVRTIPASMKRIKAVAFTDSVHSVLGSESKKIQTWFKKTTRNWISSSKPLDEPIPSYRDSDCELVSAGTDEHVWTSYVAKESVFKFINEKLYTNDKCTKDAAESLPNNDIQQSDNSGQTQIELADQNKEQHSCETKEQHSDDSVEEYSDETKVKHSDKTKEQHSGETKEQQADENKELHVDETKEEHSDKTKEQHCGETKEQHAYEAKEEHSGETREEHSDETDVQHADGTRVETEC